VKFGLDEAPASAPWLAKTRELTRGYEVSFYGASYHALALNHHGTFVTGDTRNVE
jgi:predicted nucleic acid-binding protein